jgi:aminoglycoside phosphotransferase (APT) family kinase protein
MPKDYYIQPDAPDPVLSDEQVLAFARRHAPDAVAVTGVDETGGEARTYAIDDNLIFKTQRPQQLRPSTSLKKEVLFLQQLEGMEGIRVPKVIGYGHPEPLIEYTLMTRVPGIAVRNAELTGETRRETLKDLGLMVRRLHAIPQEPLRASGLLFGDQSPVDVRWRMGSMFDTIADMIQKRGLNWDYSISPEQVGRRVMICLPDTWEIVALHSNPGPEHTFVDPISGKLTGIIDFGDAYFSHPTHDLRRFRAPEDRAAILTGYREDSPSSEEFMAVWRVACAIADIVAIALSTEHRVAAAVELDQILAESG